MLGPRCASEMEGAGTAGISAGKRRARPQGQAARVATRGYAPFVGGPGQMSYAMSDDEWAATKATLEAANVPATRVHEYLETLDRVGTSLPGFADTFVRERATVLQHLLAHESGQGGEGASNPGGQ